MSAYKFTNIKTKGFFIIFCLLFASCRNPPKTEMRKLAPSDALVYLEANSVGAMLEALTASPAFQTLAAEKPDYSALENMQIAVAVTGFETSAENSALRLKPRFVAVVETHAWSWQATALVENQFNNLVRKNYGDSAKLETIDKDGGVFFTWTAQDNRRVFAFVKDSLIYFGSDASAIEKCLAVKNGAAESLAQNEFFSRAYTGNNLAFGYVATDGIKQIAALAGVSVAVNASESDDGKSFIARILPPILQNTTREIVWTANRNERGIEDVFTINLKAETAAVLRETLISDADLPPHQNAFLPPDVYSATRYDLKNPLIGWRGLLLLTAKNTDALSGQMLFKFSNQLLEPYGVKDAEVFLSAVGAPIITAQFDVGGEKSVSIVAVKDAGKLKTSLSDEIDFKSPPELRSGAEIRYSKDKNTAAAFIADSLILGDGESVLKCLQTGETAAKNPALQRFVESRRLALTFGTDADSAAKIAALLAHPTDENRRLATFYTTETHLTDNGFERVTISDFGFIGTILKNLN